MTDAPEGLPLLMLVESAIAAADPVQVHGPHAQDTADLVVNVLGSGGRIDVPLRVLQDPSASSDLRCAAAFLTVVCSSDRTLEIVLGDLDRWAPSLAGDRFFTISHLTPPTVAFLLEGLDLLGYAEDRLVESLLEQVLRDPEPRVRQFCALAAGAIGSEDVVGPVLTPRLVDATIDEVAAACALGVGLSGSSERWLSVLWNSARTDPSGEVRLACYLSIVRLHGDISEGLFDVDPKVRAMVSSLLEPPLHERQKSRLVEVLADARAGFPEKAAAATMLLLETDHTAFLPHVRRFIAGCNDPLVADWKSAVLRDLGLPEATQEILRSTPLKALRDQHG